MNLNKEQSAYLASLVQHEAITQDEFNDITYKPEINAFHSEYLSSRFIDKINWGWSSWQAAKAQAVPAKLVLELEKDRFKEYEFKALLRQSLRASKITKSKLNWVHVMSMLGTGSTVAHRICEALGVNPDGTEFKTQEPVK